MLSRVFICLLVLGSFEAYASTEESLAEEDLYGKLKKSPAQVKEMLDNLSRINGITFEDTVNSVETASSDIQIDEDENGPRSATEDSFHTVDLTTPAKPASMPLKQPESSAPVEELALSPVVKPKAKKTNRSSLLFGKKKKNSVKNRPPTPRFADADNRATLFGNDDVTALSLKPNRISHEPSEESGPASEEKTKKTHKFGKVFKKRASRVVSFFRKSAPKTPSDSDDSTDDEAEAAHYAIQTQESSPEEEAYHKERLENVGITVFAMPASAKPIPTTRAFAMLPLKVGTDSDRDTKSDTE